MASNDILGRPECFLPSLSNAFQDEVVFFWQNVEGEVVRLSEAKEHFFCGVTRMFATCIQKEFSSPETVGNAGKRQVIADKNGEPIKFDAWRIPLKKNNYSIGYVGIMLRRPEWEKDEWTDQLRSKVSLITQAERDVLDLAVKGAMNKTIAYRLGIGIRTVEWRRSKAMSKLGVTTVADFVRLWVRVQEMESRSLTS